jgi:hypothetical protein
MHDRQWIFARCGPSCVMVCCAGLHRRVPRWPGHRPTRPIAKPHEVTVLALGPTWSRRVFCALVGY